MQSPDSQISGMVNAQSLQRGVWLESALDEVRRDLEEDRFASAIGHFREALGLSRGLPLLKARVDQRAKVYSQELLPENWRVAETILQEAAATEPLLAPDPELLKKVEEARHDELVTLALYKVDRLQLDDKAVEARQRLSDLLTLYPDEPRIQERIRAFDAPEPLGPLELVAKIPAAELEALTEPKPVEVKNAATSGLPKPFPTRVLIASSSWNAIKNFAALTTAAGMLGLAGLLLAQHFSAHRSPPQTDLPQSAGSQQFEAPVPSQPVKTGSSMFQDVPIPLSDQDGVLQAVRVFSEAKGRQIDGDVVDEVDIQGKQAKVRYRSKQKGSAANMTFSLVKQSDGWKVQKVE